MTTQSPGVSSRGSAPVCARALPIVSGGTLTFMMNGPMNVVVKDEAGHVADISTYDVRQSNGVIHVVDRVLMPAM